MRRAQDFSSAVRSGARAGRPRLVVHLTTAEPAGAAGPAQAGFVVSRAVGGAVVRNGVKRRLRHLVASRLDRLPAGSRLVIRALPPSAAATSGELAADLDAALARGLSRLGQRAAPSRSSS